jgi:hypothetical protein
MYHIDLDCFTCNTKEWGFILTRGFRGFSPGGSIAFRPATKLWLHPWMNPLIRSVPHDPITSQKAYLWLLGIKSSKHQPFWVILCIQTIVHTLPNTCRHNVWQVGFEPGSIAPEPTNGGSYNINLLSIKEDTVYKVLSRVCGTWWALIAAVIRGSTQFPWTLTGFSRFVIGLGSWHSFLFGISCLMMKYNKVVLDLPGCYTTSPGSRGRRASPESLYSWHQCCFQHFDTPFSLLSRNLCSLEAENFLKLLKRMLFFVCVCVALGLELRVFTWSHSTSAPPLFVIGIFKIGSRELFALDSFEPWSSWSLPPD